MHEALQNVVERRRKSIFFGIATKQAHDVVITSSERSTDLHATQ